MLTNIGGDDGFFFVHQRFHQLHGPWHTDTFGHGQWNLRIQRLADEQIILFFQLGI